MYNISISYFNIEEISLATDDDKLLYTRLTVMSRDFFKTLTL